MNSYVKKAVISASISSAGALLASFGTWLGSGTLDSKILLGVIIASVSSWLVAVGRIMTQYAKEE